MPFLLALVCSFNDNQRCPSLVVYLQAVWKLWLARSLQLVHLLQLQMSKADFKAPAFAPAVRPQPQAAWPALRDAHSSMSCKLTLPYMRCNVLANKFQPPLRPEWCCASHLLTCTQMHHHAGTTLTARPRAARSAFAVPLSSRATTRTRRRPARALVSSHCVACPDLVSPPR